MCGMRLQYSCLSLEKTGRASVCVPETSSGTCGGIVAMETEMEMMLELKVAQDLSAFQDHKTKWAMNVFGQRRIQNNELMTVNSHCAAKETTDYIFGAFRSAAAIFFVFIKC